MGKHPAGVPILESRSSGLSKIHYAYRDETSNDREAQQATKVPPSQCRARSRAVYTQIALSEDHDKLDTLTKEWTACELRGVARMTNVERQILLEKSK